MKYCPRCGNEIDDNAEMCSNCEKSQADTSNRKFDIVSIIGFIVGVIAVIIDIYALIITKVNPDLGTAIWLIVCLLAGSFVGGLGLLLSVIGLVIVIKRKKRGKIFAITGIAISAICLLLLLFLQLVG